MKYAYYEVQYFSWWIYLIIALVTALVTWATIRRGVLLNVGLAVGMLLLVIVMILRMVTYIEGQSLKVYFGWVPVVKKTILLSKIQDIRECSYHPMKQFGGWGWRYGMDGTQALTAKGTYGVCVRLENGDQLIVGSSRSHTLAEAIRKVKNLGS
ncbi:MAG: hypothetical protein ACPGYT_15070 [Nitrospirales bacterium]